MPDLATRSQHEEELTAAILTILLMNAGRVGPHPGDYGDFRRDLAGSMSPHLRKVYVEAAEGMVAAYGFPAADLDRAAASWADQAAEKAAAAVSVTTITHPVTGSKLDAMFGPGRAAKIAVTEITRAVTAGEIFILIQMSDDAGRELISVWYTEDDARVCPICGPLHGTPQEDWSQAEPAGPPVHPNCRCWLVYEEVRESIGEAEHWRGVDLLEHQGPDEHESGTPQDSNDGDGNGGVSVLDS